jgi:hypothetical protein
MLDPSGVALRAIQELNKRNIELTRTVSELSARVNELERVVRKMSDSSDGLETVPVRVLLVER